MNITATVNDTFTNPERARALASFLAIRWTQIDEQSCNDQAFDADGAEYEVLTDDEADQRWEESLESYLEECIYPDLPESMRFYFDDEAWKRDARTDGRGHAIAHYDGCDNDAQDPITGESFIIIRTN